jgi:serine/arginine repetitive matrix protein 2
LKVYVTPSAQIGRLIENLSQGMDAGSFKFAVNDHQRHEQTAHSHSSSYTGSEWTVERNINEMMRDMQG